MTIYPHVSAATAVEAELVTRDFARTQLERRVIDCAAVPTTLTRFGVFGTRTANGEVGPNLALAAKGDRVFRVALSLE